MAITAQQVIDKINTSLPGAIVAQQEGTDILTLEVTKDKVHALIEWLKNDTELQVNFLTNIAGIHYPDKKEREICVVYQLHSLVNSFRMRLKVYMARQGAKIPTITDLYAGANWMERETFDFFGIHFEGHPKLKRILNEDDMDYHPMLKEYHLEDATREDKDDRYFGR